MAKISMAEPVSGSVIQPPSHLVLIGLGAMGRPMAAQLKRAGYQLSGLDSASEAREAFATSVAPAFASAAEIPGEIAAILTMLPDGKIVRAALLGEAGIVPRLKAGTPIIDMSSSAPTDTLALAAELAELGLPLIDAPVSGGVKRAIDGSLAIMAGGTPDEIARVLPILEAMGKTVFQTGPSGSGHAMKSLNNYVSAAGLVAACEALLVGRHFGLAPETIIDVLNASTGRNNSTEIKMKPFVISQNYASGFSLALMAKDLRIAADLAAHLQLATPQIDQIANLWEEARDLLASGADHTEIYRFISKLR